MKKRQPRITIYTRDEQHEAAVKYFNKLYTSLDSHHDVMKYLKARGFDECINK